MPKKKLPPFLYHYTSQEGLLGIIRNGEIWATDILYLNDSMEYKYTVDLTLKAIKDRQKQISPEDHITFFSSTIESSKKPKIVDIPYRYSRKWIEYNMLDDLHLNIQESDEYHIFVFSLSKNGNLLSQWRGYCQHGNGYSIGFKTSDFSSQMMDRGLRFVECVYEKSRQERIINSFVESFIKEIRNNRKDLSES